MREQEDKLVAAEARQGVGLAYVGLENARDLPQERIALGMAESVIVLFGAVEGEDDGGDGVVVPPGQRELPLKFGKEIVAVVQMGERVQHGQLAQPFIQGAEDEAARPVDDDEQNIKSLNAVDVEQGRCDVERQQAREADQPPPKAVHACRHAISPPTDPSAPTPVSRVTPPGCLARGADQAGAGAPLCAAHGLLAIPPSQAALRRSIRVQQTSWRNAFAREVLERS